MVVDDANFHLLSLMCLPCSLQRLVQGGGPPPDPTPGGAKPKTQ